MSKATDKKLTVVKPEEDPNKVDDGAEKDVDTGAPTEPEVHTPEKKGMSTGKKVGIGVTILMAITALAVGLAKVFGGGDDADVIDTTGSVE